MNAMTPCPSVSVRLSVTSQCSIETTMNWAFWHIAYLQTTYFSFPCVERELGYLQSLDFTNCHKTSTVASVVNLVRPTTVAVYHVERPALFIARWACPADETCYSNAIDDAATVSGFRGVAALLFPQCRGTHHLSIRPYLIHSRSLLRR